MYAEREDLTKRFGEAEIASLEDLNGTGSPDPGVSSGALADATGEVDSYLGVRYALPLPSCPIPLMLAVCDIARYRLYKDRPTEQVTYRYEQALKWLGKLSHGTVTLFFDPITTPTPVVAKPAVVGAQYTGGVFGSSALDRMPSVRPLQ